MVRYKNPPNQSKGILDDHAVRKSVKSKEYADDMIFVHGGMCYGEIYVRDNVTTTTLNSAAKVQVTIFNTNGESNNTIPDHTNDHITITKAGHYLVTISMSIHNLATQKHVVSVGLFKNNGTTEFNDIHADRTLTGGSTDIGAISITGIVDVSVGDTLEVWAITGTAADRIVDFDDINLSIVQIGG